MSKRFVFSIAVVALLVAAPAMGQLNNFPILALPAGDADGATSIGAGWGRGLSDSSRKLDAIAIGAARAMETVSFGIIGSYVIDAGFDAAGAATSEIALGGSVAYNVPMDGSVDVGIQGGIEWMAPAESVSLLNFPLGVSIGTNTQAGSLDVRPWIMPRVQFTRLSPATGDSNTETDFATSAGVSGVTEGGFGVGLYVDWAYVRDQAALDGSSTSQWLFGAAVFYVLP